MLIRARAPLRLGMGGGGTDVSPYCDIYGGIVVNATIDKYAYATIDKIDGEEVCFVSTDLGLVWKGKAMPNLPLNGTLNLHKGLYNRVLKDFLGNKPIGIRLITHVEAQPGSGLGSSSTLVVAMLTCFVKLLNLPLDKYDIARYAYSIERIDVGLDGGKQDQYAAAFGGFNFMEFDGEDRVVVNYLPIKSWIVRELEASLLLYDTGTTRKSANIIEQQITNVRVSNQEAIAAMHKVKEEALVLKEGILKGDFQEIALSIERAWEAKKKMATKVSNPHIEKVCLRAKEAGAHAVKISGAGGGGYLMLLVDPVRRYEVAKALAEIGGRIESPHFTNQGAHAWRVG